MAITTGGGPWESNKEHFAERHCVSECAKGGTQGTRQWLCVARQTNEVIKWKRRTPAHTFHFLCCCSDIKRRDEKWMRGKMEWIAGGILFGKEGNLKEKRERERKNNKLCMCFLPRREGRSYSSLSCCSRYLCSLKPRFSLLFLYTFPSLSLSPHLNGWCLVSSPQTEGSKW